MTAPSPKAWGLLPHHVSTGGSGSSASGQTVDALLAALGADRRRPDRDGDRPLVVVHHGCGQRAAAFAAESGGDRRRGHRRACS